MEVNFSTQMYMNEFTQWVRENGNTGQIKNIEITGSGGFAVMDMTDEMANSVTELLEAVILSRTGLSNINGKLKYILHNIVFKSAKKNIIEIFESCIAESPFINLEGLVTFRLAQYSAQVDIVLYAAVKKMLY